MISPTIDLHAGRSASTANTDHRLFLVCSVTRPIKKMPNAIANKINVFTISKRVCFFIYPKVPFRLRSTYLIGDLPVRHDAVIGQTAFFVPLIRRIIIVDRNYGHTCSLTGNKPITYVLKDKTS